MLWNKKLNICQFFVKKIPHKFFLKSFLKQSLTGWHQESLGDSVISELQVSNHSAFISKNKELQYSKIIVYFT